MFLVRAHGSAAGGGWRSSGDRQIAPRARSNRRPSRRAGKLVRDRDRDREKKKEIPRERERYGKTKGKFIY